MKDPVCGKEVGEQTPFKVVFKKIEYRFCSMSCETQFKRDPERYAQASTKRTGRA